MLNRLATAALVAISLLLPKAATAQTPPTAETRPIAFTRLVAKLDRGDPWGSIQGGILCLPMATLTWKGGRMEVKTDDFDDVFREEVTKAGYQVEGDPNNLFEKQNSTSEYAVAGILQSIHGNFCLPYSGFANPNTKGDVTMTIEWQLYSRIARQIVAKVKTTGSYSLRNSTADGFHIILNAAFAQAVKQLVATPEFAKIAAGAPMAPTDIVHAQVSEPISFSTDDAKAPKTIGDAVGDVVVVLAGDTQGSGFLISKEGYILTNYHVVGGAKYLKVKWSDGLEALGEVVRSDKGRDVALIKTDVRGRNPLALSNEVHQPGENLYAIGAPLDLKFQNTVTKGVFSASRNYNGYPYIQSDVTVNPGNSGGPLLDEKARVIGITVAGYRVGGASTGLNLFIPIIDAEDFLGLKKQ